MRGSVNRMATRADWMRTLEIPPHAQRSMPPPRDSACIACQSSNDRTGAVAAPRASGEALYTAARLWRCRTSDRPGWLFRPEPSPSAPPAVGRGKPDHPHHRRPARTASLDLAALVGRRVKWIFRLVTRNRVGCQRWERRRAWPVSLRHSLRRAHTLPSIAISPLSCRVVS